MTEKKTVIVSECPYCNKEIAFVKKETVEIEIKRVK